MPEVRILRRWVDDPRQHEIETAIRHGSHQALAKALQEHTPDGVIDMVSRAGLRGRGGAGVSAGVKWGFMSKEPTPGRPNYLICSCDESEPGTFNNRELVEYDPHQLIEGFVIAAYALRVKLSFIYIRGEMVLGAERLAQALTDVRERGLLGESILGTGFSTEIVLHRGAGAYICGEETALMDSLEGFRGHPRSKPPFPANFGLYGMTTNINNVETLCNVPHIVAKGVDWYRGMGSEKSPGTKIMSVSGHIRRPGNYEIVMHATTLRELIYDICDGISEDRTLKAVVPGGSSMPMLPPEFLDTPMDFDSMSAVGSALGSGGMMVFDETTCIPRVALWISRFYAHESCGKCVPCRIGTDWLAKILTRIESGHGRMEDLDLIMHICANLGGERMMDSRSFCLLGDAAAWPIQWGAMKYFRHEFEYHVRHRKCMVGG